MQEMGLPTMFINRHGDMENEVWLFIILIRLLYSLLLSMSSSE